MPPLVISSHNAPDQLAEHRRRVEPFTTFGPDGCRPRMSAYAWLPGVLPVDYYLPPIPRDNWQHLIEAGEGTFLHDLHKEVLPPHDQGQTNYCWAHGSVRCVEHYAAYSINDPTILSAESVAVPITGGVNRGGSPDEALNRLIHNGACRQELWPHNDLNIRHAAPGWEADAKRRCIMRWADVPDFDNLMSCVIRRVPVSLGLGWWTHLVCAIQPVILDRGKYGIGFDNSWGPNYGENGYAVLDEYHARPTLGAFAALSATLDPIQIPNA